MNVLSFKIIVIQLIRDILLFCRPDKILTDHDKQQTQLQAVEKHIQVGGKKWLNCGWAIEVPFP